MQLKLCGISFRVLGGGEILEILSKMKIHVGNKKLVEIGNEEQLYFRF